MLFSPNASLINSSLTFKKSPSLIFPFSSLHNLWKSDCSSRIVVSTNGVDLFVDNEDGSETYTNSDNSTATTVQLFEHTYILNISSKKIHSTDCASVKTIKDENREESHLSIEELEAQGYKKCSICNAE